jgi:HEAT repeat protein
MMRRTIVSSLVLGAFAIATCSLSLLYVMSATPGEQFLAYFIGMLATAVFIGSSVSLALLLRTKNTSPHIFNALLSALRKDPDPGVRAKAAAGLAALDLEQSSQGTEQHALNTLLISTLQQDPDPQVRASAAEGLTEVELELEDPYAYYKQSMQGDPSS